MDYDISLLIFRASPKKCIEYVVGHGSIHIVTHIHFHQTQIDTINSNRAYLNSEMTH